MEEEAPPPAALAGRQRQGRRQNVFVQAVTLEVVECISCLETCVYVCQCWFSCLCAMVYDSVLSFVGKRTSEYALFVCDGMRVCLVLLRDGHLSVTCAHTSNAGRLGCANIPEG